MKLSTLSELQRSRSAIFTWLLLVVITLTIISRSHFTADLSAFLPRKPTAEQQLLMDQLKDGLASRLILVGIEGADATTRARLSKKIAQILRTNTTFVTVNNGEPITTEFDQKYLFNNRYLLSPAVTTERFTVDGLHSAISDSIDQLASPAGLLFKSLLPHDPTGEMLQLLDEMHAYNHPQLLDGAWTSRDGNTAILLLQTLALGSDTDAQKRAIQIIQAAFDHANENDSTKPTARLSMTGPGVFSVVSRDTIKSQVRIIFVVSTILIAILLLLVYRSFTALFLGFLPVATGILAGIASVSIGFGVVHGITLGFGTALIGEAVDYSIYFLMQSDHLVNSDNLKNRKIWIRNVWPTVRLGVLTSIFGFAALLLSGFPGLTQLGLYSMAGLIAATAMTRYVLPHLLPEDFQIHDMTNTGLTLSRYAMLATKIRWPAIGLILASSAIVYQDHNHLWSAELSALSPVSAADLALDSRLRAGMGAPDVRYVIVVSGNSQEQVLSTTEKLSVALQPLIKKGALTSFDSASHYLPSQTSQSARQSSLPALAILKPRLEDAIKDLPIQAKVFAPFLKDIENVRNKPLLTRSDLENTSMAMAVDAMLLNQGQRWSALMPLTAPERGNIDASQVKAALNQVQVSNALLVDLKTESNHLYAGYMHEAIILSLAGLLGITLLLLLVLRSPIRVLRSLLFANIATVLGFGLLAFSSVPVLQAMGVIVAPGVILALIFSAVFARISPVNNSPVNNGLASESKA